MDAQNPTSKDLRTFGLILGCLLGAFGFFQARKGASIAPQLLILGALSILVALAKPAAMIYIFRPWVRVTGVIGRINTFVILGVLYYLVMAPYGRLLRLFGYDLLDQKLRTGASYWKPKRKTDLASYEHQF